jgi:taurine transport system permease protein
VTIPVLSLWLGAGQTVIVCTVIFSAWIPLYLGALQGARSVAARQLWVARSFDASAWSTIRHIIVPSALVQMIPALRVGMGYAWRAVIAAEIVIQQGEGLGVTIFAARQFFDVATMYAGVFLIAALGLTIEKILFPELERRTLKRWGLIA